MGNSVVALCIRLLYVARRVGVAHDVTASSKLKKAQRRMRILREKAMSRKDKYLPTMVVAAGLSTILSKTLRIHGIPAKVHVARTYDSGQGAAVVSESRWTQTLHELEQR